MQVALRIEVSALFVFREGVPNLLQRLDRCRVRATFYWCRDARMAGVNHEVSSPYCSPLASPSSVMVFRAVP